METPIAAALGALLGLWGLTLPVVDRAVWLRRIAARLAEGSALVPTPAGPVEVGLAGEGPPVLVLHDAPGGFDAGLALGAHLADAGMRVLAPSRPGYLRTPLGTGPHPEQAADALAAALDALGFGVVAVLAAGHGGPTALALALRHPGRVRALVLRSACARAQPLAEGVTPGWARLAPAHAPGLEEHLALYTLALLARVRPGLAARRLSARVDRLGPLQREELAWALEQQPEQRRRLRAWLDGLALPARRWVGVKNDLEQLAGLPDWPLEALQVPTLVSHGALAARVGLGHAELAANRIPHAELDLVDSGGDLLWLGPRAPAVLARELGFLWQHSRPPPG